MTLIQHLKILKSPMIRLELPKHVAITLTFQLLVTLTRVEQIIPDFKCSTALTQSTTIPSGFTDVIEQS